ncbi:MAG TPA: (2Fe-2S)-binding protein, partial [Streptosporangiaceae bacterium]|nr:(2Fe-2S)-binding protein [Streptosporangiaceae bacterium]
MPGSLSTVRRDGKHRKPSWARRPAALAERVEQAHALDPVVRALSDVVVRALPVGPRTDALHGVPFGQPAHPALVRLPLGCWTSAVLLDLFRGTDRAARMLIGAGVAVTVPAAATGLA